MNKKELYESIMKLVSIEVKKVLNEQKEIKEYVFVIDCDEVIRPLIRNMVDFYNDTFNQNLTYEDVYSIDKEYKMFPLIPGDPCEWLFLKNGKEIYLMRPPINGAVDAIKTLRKYGKVIIATNQLTSQNKLWTIEWLDKYGIEYDSILFGRNKQIINCDYLIDDDPLYFKGAIAQHGIFIDSVHNMSVDLSKLGLETHCITLQRFKSLKHFADFFEKNIIKNI